MKIVHFHILYYLYEEKYLFQKYPVSWKDLYQLYLAKYRYSDNRTLPIG